MKGMHVIVGVTGGIAAYKAVDFVSRLRKQGAEVQVVMTEHATKFVTPLTFGEISGHPVSVSMFQEVINWDVEHIALATWADAYIIVPATANIIGKIANGIADDMLSTQVMATKAPVFICPAMNTNMYENPITQRNLQTLRDYGYHIMEPDSGHLACGTSGKGRLPDPAAIIDWFDFTYHKSQELAGQTVVVTAGGTQEAIDPVRYIGNRSSGKMGYALAAAAARHGAHTILITTPTQLAIPMGVQAVTVHSAKEMKQAVDEVFDDCQALIMAAAVADYRVRNQAPQKLKKQEDFTLDLVKNPDILKEAGQRKQKQKLIGFAAETEHLIENARKKVDSKHLDFLVANDVSQQGSGFNVDTNQVSLVYADGTIKEFPLLSKKEVAERVIIALSELKK